MCKDTSFEVDLFFKKPCSLLVLQYACRACRRCHLRRGIHSGTSLLRWCLPQIVCILSRQCHLLHPVGQWFTDILWNSGFRQLVRMDASVTIAHLEFAQMMDVAPVP